MATRKSVRKRQTQLKFTPVPSSSPQRPEAQVRIDEVITPTKKRKVGSDPTLSSQLGSQLSPFSQSRVQVVVHAPAGKPVQLPTPLPSSQTEPGPSTRNRVLDHESTAADKDSARRVTEDQNVVISSDDEEEEIISKTTRRQRPLISLSSDSDASDAVTRILRHPRKAIDFESPRARSPTHEQDTPSKPRSARSFLLGGNSGTAPIPHYQTRRKPSSTKETRQRTPSVTTSSSPDNDFEGGKPVSSSKRKLRSSDTPPTRPARHNEAPLNWSLSGTESDNPTARKGEKSPLNESQSMSDSDLPITPIRRRGKPIRTSPDHIREPDSDLEAEVADLKDVDRSQTPKSRTRGTLHKSERSKRMSKLEELKRRRAGVVEVSEDESQESPAEDDNDVRENGFGHDVGPDLDEYEEDFIEDDEDEAIGIDLAGGGVPIGLTRYANLKPFEYFKYVVEWMVHAKLDPAFERNDEVYVLAHKKLDDEVTGHAGSTFKSSVWGQEFADALMSRPDIFRVDIPTMHERKCDACNRSGHPPKHRIILSGSRYDKKTLEKISNNDSDSEDNTSNDDNSTESKDEQTFFLGRFCCANAEIAHALYHWRYHLNETILEWLSTNGHTTPEKIIERENWSRKKREKLANKIVDGMVEEGAMKVLYLQFKQNLEAARSAKVCSSFRSHYR